MTLSLKVNILYQLLWRIREHVKECKCSDPPPPALFTDVWEKEKNLENFSFELSPLFAIFPTFSLREVAKIGGYYFNGSAVHYKGEGGVKRLPLWKNNFLRSFFKFVEKITTAIKLKGGGG